MTRPPIEAVFRVLRLRAALGRLVYTFPVDLVLGCSRTRWYAFRQTTLTRELRLGLRDLGYSEGQNFVFQLRSADGDAARLPQLATDLVSAQVDVIVATFTPCALAAKRATTTIPIVM